MSHQHTSTPNSSDKNEPLTKEEWQSRLESFDFKQADMNKLIMNYLVTGRSTVCMAFLSHLNCFLNFNLTFHRGFQRGGRKISSRSWR